MLAVVFCETNFNISEDKQNNELNSEHCKMDRQSLLTRRAKFCLPATEILPLSSSFCLYKKPAHRLRENPLKFISFVSNFRKPCSKWKGSKKVISEHNVCIIFVPSNIVAMLEGLGTMPFNPSSYHFEGHYITTLLHTFMLSQAAISQFSLEIIDLQTLAI